jgi:hypothetical protein
MCNFDDLAIFRCATDRFGLKFFKDPTYSDTLGQWLEIPNAADVEYNVMLTDTANWTLVEGWFTADEAYNWIALGNMYDDSQTDTLQMGDPGSCYGYYYIDNVCIGLWPNDCSFLLSSKPQTSNERKIEIYPNPASSEFTVSSDRDIQKVIIYNAIGEIKYTALEQNRSLVINCAHWSKGIYFVKIIWDDQQISTSKFMKL